jgi:hypothetical protein
MATDKDESTSATPTSVGITDTSPTAPANEKNINRCIPFKRKRAIAREDMPSNQLSTICELVFLPTATVWE